MPSAFCYKRTKRIKVQVIMGTDYSLTQYVDDGRTESLIAFLSPSPTTSTSGNET